MKRVLMIPARLGSKRVKQKNIRLIQGKPLISYAIEAAKEADCFDEIYVNSESDIIGEIAENLGVKWYKRSEDLASDEATNDNFALDFFENVECSVLYQLLPSSPFISPEEIRGFVSKMEENNIQTLISVKEEQISCLYKGKPVNFDPYRIVPPSQSVTPVQVYATSLMAWERESFFENQKKFGATYHGGEGAIGFYILEGYSTIDIDNEEDFQIAEVIAQSLGMERKEPEYYTNVERVEVDVPSILARDGVELNDLFDVNNERVSIPEIIASKPSNKSWSKRLVDNENNSATLIHQMPSEGNRRHYHDNWNEWWYIVQGQWKWEIEGREITVKEGDFVYIEKGKWHQITAIGDSPAIRLAVSRADVNHIYQKEE